MPVKINYFTKIRADLKQIKNNVKQDSLMIVDLNKKVNNVNQLIGGLDKRFGGLDRQFGYLNGDFKSLYKRFDDLEQKLIGWKSDLFTKIDKSYAKPIRDLQEESASQQVRQNRQQKEIDKIKLIALNQ